MSFIIWTDSLNIWHYCMRLKGHCEALWSGVSLGLNKRTVACWLGCQQSCLRWDAPCLSWSGVPPEKLSVSALSLARKELWEDVMSALWADFDDTTTICPNAACSSRGIAQKEALRIKSKQSKDFFFFKSKLVSFLKSLAIIWVRKSVNSVVTLTDA